MLLALLSDTHDNAAATKAALEMLAPHRPAAYLHAGDMVAPEMLALFAGLEFHFVFGNNEYDLAGLRSMAVSLGVHCHERVAELEFAGKRVVVVHGHEQGVVDEALRGRPAYLIHGHTHVRRDERFAGTRIINPGAVHRSRARSVALLHVAKDTLEFLSLPARS